MKQDTPPSASPSLGTPRRTFLKRAGGLALGFTIVDLATVNALALTYTCEGKTYASEGDGNCNPGMSANTYNRDEACSTAHVQATIGDEDAACGMPVPANKIQEVTPGGNGPFYDRDQSCATGVMDPTNESYDQNKGRPNNQVN